MTLPDRFARPELGAVWQRAWRAMATAGDGWTTVRITVPLASDEERRAVAGLLGRVVRAGTASVGVALGELDAVVRRPADGWDLRAVVEAVSGPVPDRRGVAAARSAAADAVVAAALAAGPTDDWFVTWVGEMAVDGTVSRLVGRGDGDVLAGAGRALAALPVDGEPLPAFAARLTGDTKALSSGTLAGLVLRGVAARFGEDRPATAAARRTMWESVGVVPDDLASQVLALNLRVRPASALGAWLAAAASEGEPFRVTLHQLARWPVALERPGTVFVCENPAVLRAAASRLRASSASIVCTEGRPSVAAARLLDALVGSGASLRVRADFDWPGLRIAGSLLDRPAARPWRFTADDYRGVLQCRAAGSRPRAGVALDGAPASSPWDPSLAVAMASAGEAVYEEELLDDLVDDLR